MKTLINTATTFGKNLAPRTVLMLRDAANTSLGDLSTARRISDRKGKTTYNSKRNRERDISEDKSFSATLDPLFCYFSSRNSVRPFADATSTNAKGLTINTPTTRNTARSRARAGDVPQSVRHPRAFRTLETGSSQLLLATGKHRRRTDGTLQQKNENL